MCGNDGHRRQVRRCCCCQHDAANDPMRSLGSSGDRAHQDILTPQWEVSERLFARCRNMRTDTRIRFCGDETAEFAAWFQHRQSGHPQAGDSRRTRAAPGLGSGQAQGDESSLQCCWSLGHDSLSSLTCGPPRGPSYGPDSQRNARLWQPPSDSAVAPIMRH